MTDPHARPPRVAERLVRLIGGRSPWRETVLGDLREEHAALAGVRGRLAAHRWYWRQALGLAAHAAADRSARVRLAVASLLFLGDRPMHNMLQEVRYAGRALRRQPLVTAAIVLTLALGLGVNAAAFSILDALVLRPFSLRDVDRLAVVSEWSDEARTARESVAPANFVDWTRQATSFDRMAAYVWWQVNFAGGDEAERVMGFQVTAGFFPALGLTPAAGRFVSEDDVIARRRVVVLSDALWKRRFGGRADILSQTVLIDGETFDVVGIAPAGFDFPMGAALWGPWAPTPDTLRSRRDRDLTVIAHLAPGRTLDQAGLEMNVIGDRLLQQYPRENEGYRVRVQSLSEGLIDTGLDQVMLMVQIGALLVLVIGGANVANLLLARGWDRQREIALRLAIGSGRARVLRLLLVESAVLAAIAVPVALAFAWAGLHVLRGAMPARVLPFVPGWTDIDIDARLILIISVGAVAASALFSLFPAIQASKPNLMSVLKEGGRSVTGGRAGRVARNALVVAEIALALPLLAATGLAVSAADQFARGPQGYDPRGVITMRTVLPEATYDDTGARRRFTERLIDETSRLPGVESAGTTTFVPSGDSNSTRELVIDGRADPGEGRRPQAPYRAVSSKYFETLRIAIVSGRAFSSVDTAGGAPVAIVSQALADRDWPGENALGRQFTIAGSEDKRAMTIVGIAGNIIDDWTSRRNSPVLYVAAAQRPSYIVNLVVRASGDATQLSNAVRGVLQSIDPAQPAVHVMTMSAMLHERTVGLAMIGAIMGVLGVLAMALAAVGLYSLMAYHVSQRRHEIGVRMALGASRSAVIRLTMGRAWWLAASGILVGLVPAVALSGVVRNVLFGVVSAQPALYAGIIVMLVGVALVASLLPARQATRIDPATALRAE